MTNEQAATKLTNIAHDDIYAWHPAILEAFRMAIEALKHSEIPNSSDTISRQAAIDAIESHIRTAEEPYQLSRADEVMNHAFEIAASCVYNLPSAQPEQQHERVFKGIVVEYPSYNTYPEYKGKPYFSIKYTENGQWFIGYGTYKPDVLSEYLKEYFMSSAQPEPLSDAYAKAVWTWLLEYQIKVAELKGRYTPYEVLSWVANDWRKEHEGSDRQTGGD